MRPRHLHGRGTYRRGRRARTDLRRAERSAYAPVPRTAAEDQGRRQTKDRGRMTPRRAIVRPPGNSYPRALTRLAPPPRIDVTLARAQHAAYVAALRECGLEVIALPPNEEHPDAVFTQDPVVVL